MFCFAILANIFVGQELAKMFNIVGQHYWAHQHVGESANISANEANMLATMLANMLGPLCGRLKKLGLEGQILNNVEYRKIWQNKDKYGENKKLLDLKFRKF